ncbi:MAG: hybrid sensor histidine kinase/response regulator [Pseudomonadota bacterium]
MPAETEYQARRSLRALLDDARWSLVTLAHWAVVGVLVWTLARDVPVVVIGGWAAVISSVILGQAIFASYWNERRQSALSAVQVSRVLRSYTASAWLVGLCWAASTLLLFPEQNPELQLFLVFVVSGVALATVATQHVHLPACYGSMGVALPMLAGRYALNEQWLPAVLLIAFALVLLRLAWALAASARHTSTLQRQRDDLLEVLRKRAKELERARMDSEEANLAKSRFLAQASHDLRQPLHAIGLLAESLPEAQDARSRLVIEHMQDSIAVLSGLFDSLLDIAVLDSGKTRPKLSTFALKPLYDELKNDFEPIAAEAGVTLRFVRTRAIVRSDPLLLRRMLQNLISNAIRYAPAGRVVIGGRRLVGSCAIDVVDNGPGISPEDQRSVFQEFVRIRRDDVSRAPGLGLGLAIVGRLAEVLGLSVRLDSQPGHGTRFRIGGLEAGMAPEITTTRDKVKDARNHLQGVGVLVVDDDRKVLDATAALLGKWDCDVVAQTEFPEILPDVKIVLSDYELVGDNGLVRLKALRHQCPELVSILISGDPSPEVRREAEEAGIPLLRKPVRPVQLRSLLLKLSTAAL